MLTHPLRPEQIPQAYPVVRQIMEDLTLPGWIEYAHAVLARPSGDRTGSGIIVAETLNNRIRGLFVYKVEPSLDHGRVLTIQHFILPGLGRATVAEMLYGAIRVLAERNACNSIHIEVPPQTKWELDFFQKQGHRVINWMLCHPTAPQLR